MRCSLALSIRQHRLESLKSANHRSLEEEMAVKNAFKYYDAEFSRA